MIRSFVQIVNDAEQRKAAEVCGPISTLRALLCGPDGSPALDGSDADLSEVGRALRELEEMRDEAIQLMLYVDSRGHVSYGPDCHVCRAVAAMQRWRLAP